MTYITQNDRAIVDDQINELTLRIYLNSKNYEQRAKLTTYALMKILSDVYGDVKVQLSDNVSLSEIDQALIKALIDLTPQDNAKVLIPDITERVNSMLGYDRENFGKKLLSGKTIGGMLTTLGFPDRFKGAGGNYAIVPFSTLKHYATLMGYTMTKRSKSTVESRRKGMQFEAL